MPHRLKTYCLYLTLVLFLIGGSVPVDAQKRKAATKAKTEQKKTTSTRSKSKSSSKSKNTRSKSSRSRTSAKTSSKKRTTPETSAEAKRRQEETQKEIARTKEELRRNEAEVKKGLSELNRLNADITTGRNLVAKATEQVQQLDSRIATLETEISTSEAQLKKMREDYLRSVKKIRGKKNSNSALAFIFSSKNFSQAMRRMRYLKQVSAWRSKKSAEISASVKELTQQKELLVQSRREKDIALSRQIAAQNQLNTQYQRQDAVVGELRRNGQALQSHLAKKQQEANALKSRIAALIAEENRKAEEARRAEEARKAAEEARLAEEARKAEEAKLLAEQTEKSKPEEKQEKKKDKKQTKKADKQKGKQDYAEARKRKPRSSKPSESEASASPDVNKNASAKASASQAGNFAAMRGSLPRPVSGAFRVTSQFGRHSLPELPDIMYDNPGIDAETSAGASAQAVYGGKVSGVYVIPGFSTVIIINHGNYYTVYGNISSPAVKVGDVVKQGQALGRLGPDEEDPTHSSIHFEVWKNRDKLNPLDWIR
jgi:peptidase M23